MNIDNGHLVDFAKLFNIGAEVDAEEENKIDEKQVEEERVQDLLERMNELKSSMQERGYKEVPKELETAAEKKLSGKAEAYVSLTSGGKLSKWAAKQRKTKRKMANQGRRKNR